MRALLGRMALAAASGLALAAAFPPLAWSGLGWVALAPLLAAAHGRPPREAAGLAVLSGLAFWIPSLRWVGCVTTAGWMLLALCCALYMLPPVLLWARWPARRGEGAWARLAGVAAFTACWTGTEHLRGVLFTGFPWNPLGVSQVRSLSLLQHAAWGGTAALSFLLAFANAALASTLRRLPGAVRRRARLGGPELAVAVALALAADVTGRARLNAWTAGRAAAPPRETLALALVQPAVPQFEKWTPLFVVGMYGRLRLLTLAALRGTPPDLVVWPETALPEDLRSSREAGELLAGIEWNGVPLLAGALDSGLDGRGQAVYFNTAFLLDGGVRILETYDKQHLVLFGETVPFVDRIPWLKRLTPVEQLVSPGRRRTVFTVPGKEVRFSSLICFEDVLSHIARGFAQAGAELLVNQTNDAWFDGTAGARQHLWNAIPRAVETRTPLVRCTNSGITCWVDETGRVRRELPAVDAGGRPVSGFIRLAVPPRPAAAPLPFFARRGAVFGWACAGAGLAALGAMLLRRRHAAPPPNPARNTCTSGAP
jgi:apolipoprotein N-acyltransferase